ncbi:molybdopterin-dependent oxidoreductase [Sulfurospirillum sp. 1612]|uniref:molybdopterin-dependent oxidoreductase n=1 Tax=Sulfurospirillum sp. 1612 TaxID=3094835 RepID=UPI002F924C27
MKNEIIENKPMDRRSFLKTSALLGGSAACLGAVEKINSQGTGRGKIDYPLNDAENVIYSVCLQCHTACPIKVKIEDGVAVKIDGNPYSIQNLNSPIPTSTDIQVGAKIDAGLCPKGQAGIQTIYDPYRVVKVLKRDGKRGENKWKVIPFDQAITEVVEGGKLFSHVPGEENRVVEGLRQVRALQDASIAKAMAADAMNVGKGKMALADFKAKYKAHLHTLIDPDQPDLGPKNNQFVMLAGRMEHGRKELAKRWQKGSFGSINFMEHTTVCEQSHHIAYKQVTSQYLGKGKWKPAAEHLKPDFRNARFVIFFGTGFVEANFGPPIMANLVTNSVTHEGCKVAVVDPRFSKSAAKAWQWVPVRPGGDAALIYAMIRWMFENDKINKEFLANANKAAAKNANEESWTSATHLVAFDKEGPGKKLRASDIGIGTSDEFVTTKDGKPVAVNTNDKLNPIVGDLFFSGELGGIKVKSELMMVKEYAMSKSMEEWAKEAGLSVKEIVKLTREYTKYGRQAGAEMYRGPVQHTNGYYNGMAVIYLNMLIGNIDYNGGLIKGGGHYHEDGSKGGPFNLKVDAYPGKTKAFGHKITREGSYYEHSSYFQKYGYPAKRPWFPHTGNVYQEAIPSMDDAYPYSVKILMTIMGTPLLSNPAAQMSMQTILDLKKTPLYIANDVAIGESSMFADYIFPDEAIWERWGSPHVPPSAVTKMSKFRQPTIEPLTDVVSVFGEKQHIGYESMLLAMAEKLGLPGFGDDGFGKGIPFKRTEDWYLKLAANIAAGDHKGDDLPEADDREIAIFKKARRHMSSATFDFARWEKACIDANGKNWFKKTIYLLNRGARGEDFTKYTKNVANSDKILHKFGKMFNFYCENVANTRHCYTGKKFGGISQFNKAVDYTGKEVVGSSAYPLRSITYKPITGGQARTQSVDYWLQAIMPENTIDINAQTASDMGLRDGDMAKIVSADNPSGNWDLGPSGKKPMIGKIRAIEGLKPGVISVSWSFGHWAYGARDIMVDGTVIKGEKARESGLCSNAALTVDSGLKNSTLEDMIGGSAVFYDSFVGLEKV